MVNMNTTIKHIKYYTVKWFVAPEIETNQKIRKSNRNKLRKKIHQQHLSARKRRQAEKMWLRYLLMSLIINFTTAVLENDDNMKHITKTSKQDNDEKAAEHLIRLSYVAALKKIDNTWLLRRRRMEHDLHKKDEFTDDYTIPFPRHFYDITIPNDEFRLRDAHEEENHIYEHENHEHAPLLSPSITGEPHPAVAAAHAMETDVNSLLASANTLKMQSMTLQSKAAELEKQAEILHSNAGGPIISSQDRPLTAADAFTLTDQTHSSLEHQHTQVGALPHGEVEQPHFEDVHTKCCQNGEGPERGGSSARPVINGQIQPGNGNYKAPPPPVLGPATYERESPIHQINIGYPMFNLPPRTNDMPIPEYIKPLPPILGNNPYEVLTSSSLNGTAYKINPFGLHSEDHAHAPLFTQKYIISIKTNDKQNVDKTPTMKTENGQAKTLKSSKQEKKNKTKRKSQKMRKIRKKRKSQKRGKIQTKVKNLFHKVVNPRKIIKDKMKQNAKRKL